MVPVPAPSLSSKNEAWSRLKRLLDLPADVPLSRQAKRYYKMKLVAGLSELQVAQLAMVHCGIHFINLLCISIVRRIALATLAQWLISSKDSLRPFLSPNTSLSSYRLQFDIPTLPLRCPQNTGFC